MDYAVASLICAASLAGVLVLYFFHSHAVRRLKAAEAGLAARSAELHELVAENLELERQVAQLRQTEAEFFALRREYGRTSSMLHQLARIETGLRLELDRLHERQALSTVPASLRPSIEPAPQYSPQAA